MCARQCICAAMCLCACTCLCGYKMNLEIISENYTYAFVELMVIQSLRGQEETKEAEMQKAEDRDGCALPGDTTQPNAT